MEKVIIIAEAGVNHNGDKEVALKLIEAAAFAGADYIKFQTFKADKLVSKNAPKADYQEKNSGHVDSHYQMLKKLEMPYEWYNQLLAHCKQHGIKFLSTGFDEESIDFLDSLGMDFYKIPSGEITNKPYLQHVARKRKRVVLSTGMSSLQEINEAIMVIVSEGLDKKNITVLHCNTEYPTPMQDVNLTAMNHIQAEFDVMVGYSDHTLGIEVPVAAVALGAKIIEKHFTMNRTMLGPDHAASLEPNELLKMIRAIRNIEKAISGNGKKEPSASEHKNIFIARKSIHLARPVSKGHPITFADLIMKRPGDGISPMKIDDVIGKTALHDLAEGDILQWGDIR